MDMEKEMTVKELIALLESMDGEFIVLFVNLFDADLFNLFGSINLHFSQISQ